MSEHTTQGEAALDGLEALLSSLLGQPRPSMTAVSVYQLRSVFERIDAEQAEGRTTIGLVLENAFSTAGQVNVALIGEDGLMYDVVEFETFPEGDPAVVYFASESDLGDAA